MRIAEIYRSVQGEGFLTGAESVFVRTSGCNLRCWYCDTPYASWTPEGQDQSLDEVLAQLDLLACDHVVLTGGEPMLFAELTPLTGELRRRGKHITIETAGTRHLPVECDLMSISPKLSGSAPAVADWPQWHAHHEQSRHVPRVVRRLVAEHPYQIKFVVDSPADCAEVEAYLADFPEIARARVMLMPQGRDAETLARQSDWLEPYCHANHLRYCPRKHIEWFGLVRGT